MGAKGSLGRHGKLLGRYVPATLVLAAGLACTYLGYRGALHYERAALELRFQSRVERSGHVFEDLLNRQIHLARAVLALFRSSVSVELPEFQTFAQAILGGSDLSVVEWVPYVPASKRAAFESTLKGAPGFTELSKDGVLVPAGTREEYFPIYYTEPFAGNEHVLGFDLGSEPTRRNALLAARDSGELAVAGPIRVVQDLQGPLSYLLILPHYRAPASDVAKRRKELVGFVVAVLQAEKVLKHATALAPIDNVSLSIADGDQVVAGRDSPRVRTQPSAPYVEFQVPLQLGPRRLLMRATGGRRFEGERASLLPAFILVGGSAMSMLVALYLARLTTTIARQRETQESLRRAELRYRTAFEEAPEAIAIMDPYTLRFVDVNPAGEALLKMSRSEFLNRDPRTVSPPFQPDGQPSAERAAAFIQRVLAGEKPSFDWQFQDANGEPVQCEVRLGIIPGEQGDLVRCSGVDISERRRAEMRQLELLRELDHRVKNCFATVLALAEQTARSAGTLNEFGAAFSGRVRALARAHEALAARRWTGAPIHEIANLVLGPYQSTDSDRIRIHGEPTILGPQAASVFSMVIHELATNAAKYGALSVPEGYVELSWECGDDALLMEWHERKAPEPTRSRAGGFGTTLVRGLVEHELGGTVDITDRPDGLFYRFVVPREHVLSAAAIDDMSPAQPLASRTAHPHQVQG